MKTDSIRKMRYLIYFNIFGLVFFSSVWGLLGLKELSKYGIDINETFIIFQPKFLSTVGAIILALNIWFISFILKGERAG